MVIYLVSRLTPLLEFLAKKKSKLIHFFKKNINIERFVEISHTNMESLLENYREQYLLIIMTIFFLFFSFYFGWGGGRFVCHLTLQQKINKTNTKVGLCLASNRLFQQDFDAFLMLLMWNNWITHIRGKSRQRSQV